MTTTVEAIEIDRMMEENAELLSFLYACPVGLVEMSFDGTMNMMNPLAMQLLFKLHPAMSVNFYSVVAVYGAELRNLVESYSAMQGVVCLDHHLLLRGGIGTDVDPEVFACTIIKLGVDRFMVTLSDISTQVRQAQKLKEAESWFASLLDGVKDYGVLSLDASGHIDSVNAAIPEQTGFQKEDLIGQSLDVLAWTTSLQGSLSSSEQLTVAAREGWHLHEDWQRHKDGSKLWYQRLVAVRHDPQPAEGGAGDISGYTVVLREGPQRSVDLQALKQMLTRDHLTGVSNRMHFFEAADQECLRKKRYGHPLSLVMIDIDFFKRVNDLYGHAGGDRVLVQFAQRCMSLLRPIDTLARVGGEEFAILMPSTTLEGAQAMAERLRSSVEAMRVDLVDLIDLVDLVDAVDKTLQVTGSFGCAELGAACGFATLMADADAALYEAKQTGRNRVVARQVSLD